MKSDLFEFYSDEGAERCGFVLKDDSIVELENIHPEPQLGFEIDSVEILRYIDDLKIIWHTHPGSTSTLSGEDKNYMEMWPDVEHVIIGSDGLKVYKVQNGVVLNENYLAWSPSKNLRN